MPDQNIDIKVELIDNSPAVLSALKKPSRRSSAFFYLAIT